MKRWYLVLLLPVMALTVRLAYATDSTQLNTSVLTRLTGFTAHQPAPISFFARDTIPTDEEISETGILKQVDDAGYPLVILTIEFTKQHLTEQFTIDLEDIANVRRNTLTGLIGSQIAFRYTTETTNALLDIQIDGTSLLDVDARIITPKTRQVVGILGADEITTGDVPGLLLITAADGEVTEFPFFITSELLEVNGTTVVAFYEERTQNSIKAITFAK